MVDQLTNTEIIELIRTKSKTSSKPFKHKICHHAPKEEDFIDSQYEWKKKFKQFLDEVYKDRTVPGLYVTDLNYWPQILEEHPEIEYYASLQRKIEGEEQTQLNEIRDFAPGAAEGFAISDWDQRAASSSNPPSEENVKPIVDYLKKWYENGTPSMLVRCAQGQYRSAVTALAAHSMISGNPAVSGILLVLSERTIIDSNWEIARIADPMLGFDGKLYSAALNVQRATSKRRDLTRSGASMDVIIDELLTLFHEPWDFDKARAYDKKKF